MNIEQIINEMTLEEKATFCSGSDFWRSQKNERLGIPAIMMCDGPSGLRKQPGEGDHLGIKPSIPATCFPSAAALASSFDTALVRLVAQTVGKACQAEQVSMLLGPGINIKRSPLCGRNFEYYSEDPFLSGKMGSAFVQGLQGQGVSACVKHFAANNQETRRMSGNSIVDERTLHEIFLAAFERVVKEARPDSVMCSYNQVNGTYMAENSHLLNEVLRNRWGFDGCIVTDWGAVKDRVKGILAGLDLEMPGGSTRGTEQIIKAVQNGTLTVDVLDQTIRRLLILINRALANRQSQVSTDLASDFQVAVQAATRSAILLKNDDQLLPLAKSAKLAVIGEFAKFPRYQGSGSSHVNSWQTRCFLDVADNLNITYTPGFRMTSGEKDHDLKEQALLAAQAADVAVIFAGLPDDEETEGFDRTKIDLPADQNDLIQSILKVQPRTVVILHHGAPVAMPWINQVPAVLDMYLAGDGVGEATARLLFGDDNPSGKLAETFPLKLADTPAYLNFPGENGQVEYREGIFVGYRYYDKKEMAVLFPFGHGLSYTQFEYKDLKLSHASLQDVESLQVRLTVRNCGNRSGEEVVQLYVGDLVSTRLRPVRELKGFAKISLQPGEQKEISFALDKRAFAYYEVLINDWHVESGEFIIEVGSSSRDIRLREIVQVNSSRTLPSRYTGDSVLGDVLQSPNAQAVLGRLLQNRSSASITSDMDAMGSAGKKMADAMMLEMPLSALQTFAGMSDEQLQSVLDALNRSGEEQYKRQSNLNGPYAKQ